MKSKKRKKDNEQPAEKRKRKVEKMKPKILIGILLMFAIVPLANAATTNVSSVQWNGNLNGGMI